MKSLQAKFMKKSKLKTDLELNNFLKSLLKSSLGHETCEIKIENGAHSPIGKLITKLCTKKKP